MKRLIVHFALLSWMLSTFACSERRPLPEPTTPAKTPPQTTPSARAERAKQANGPPLEWQPHTFSPRPSEAADPADSLILRTCGEGDRALHRVAARQAKRQLAGEPPLEVDQTEFALRAFGAPYVWPRAWSLEGKHLDREKAAERLKDWLAGFEGRGQRRCGVANLKSNEREVLVVIGAEALADLDPLPTEVRLGELITISARMLVPVTGAELVALAPDGPPKLVPLTLEGDRLRAEFRVRRSGRFVFQVLADVEGGPRPVLEAVVYANQTPPPFYSEPVAPGEHAARRGDGPERALLRMLNAARQLHALPPLSPHPVLTDLARQHAEGMQRLGSIAHDVGNGSPRYRVEAAGLPVHVTGENVARASSVRRAHRALWRSPSHRGNTLHPRFDTVGIGVVTESDGTVWVCELFADLR